MVEGRRCYSETQRCCKDPNTGPPNMNVPPPWMPITGQHGAAVVSLVMPDYGESVGHHVRLFQESRSATMRSSSSLAPGMASSSCVQQSAEDI